MRSLSNLLKHSVIIVDGVRYCLFDTQENAERNDIKSAEIDDSIDKKHEKLLWRARADAFKIVEEAERFYKIMVRNAEEKAKSNLNEAKEIGYAEGFQKGKEEADILMREKLSELSELISVIERQKEEILQKYEESLKDLALSVAKRVIETELQSGDEAFLSLYKNAVQEIGKQEWIKLTVSENEEKFATSNSELLRSMVKGAKSIKIITLEDASIGTCIVETPQGIIDSSAETQLELINEAFSKEEKPA